MTSLAFVFVTVGEHFTDLCPAERSPISIISHAASEMASILLLSTVDLTFTRHLLLYKFLIVYAADD